MMILQVRQMQIVEVVMMLLLMMVVVMVVAVLVRRFDDDGIGDFERCRRTVQNGKLQ